MKSKSKCANPLLQEYSINLFLFFAIQIIFADDTVVDLLSNYKDNEFSTLVDAIKKAGMEETLKGREWT